MKMKIQRDDTTRWRAKCATKNKSAFSWDEGLRASDESQLNQNLAGIIDFCNFFCATNYKLRHRIID